jgi:hypothetical protein
MFKAGDIKWDSRVERVELARGIWDQRHILIQSRSQGTMDSLGYVDHFSADSLKIGDDAPGPNTFL